MMRSSIFLDSNRNKRMDRDLVTRLTGTLDDRKNSYYCSLQCSNALMKFLGKLPPIHLFAKRNRNKNGTIPAVVFQLFVISRRNEIQ
jgi:hypothetical protein